MTLDELLADRTDTPLLEDVAFAAMLASVVATVQAERAMQKKGRGKRRPPGRQPRDPEPAFDDGLDMAEQLW